MQFLTVFSSSSPVFGVHRLTSPIGYLYDYETSLRLISQIYMRTHTHVHTHSQLFNSNRLSTISLYWGSLMSAFYTGDRS